MYEVGERRAVLALRLAVRPSSPPHTHSRRLLISKSGGGAFSPSAAGRAGRGLSYTGARARWSLHDLVQNS